MRKSDLSLATLVLGSTALLAAGGSLPARAQSQAASSQPSSAPTGATASAEPGAKPSAYEGVSKPPTDSINASEETPAVAPPPPSVASAAAPAGLPAAAPAPPSPRLAAAAPVTNPDYDMVGAAEADAGTASANTPLPAPTLQGRPVFNPDAEIVTSVPAPDNELPEGTPIHARLDQQISSSENGAGTLWTARVSQDVTQNGRVIIPVGSSIHGRVTRAESGHRISGPATLRLNADEVVLPDGTHYFMHALVSQTSRSSGTKVKGEGAIESKDHPVRLASQYIMGGGGGAIVGAEVAGPAGAIAGSAIGLGVVTAHWLITKHAAVLPANSTITFGLTQPMKLTSSRENAAVAGR